MSKNIDIAIGNIMNAMKQAKKQGSDDQPQIKRIMTYLNTARNMNAINDAEMARAMIDRAVDGFRGLDESVKEGFLGFGGGKGKQTVGDVPNDRMARATSSADTTAATRNKWMGTGKGREHRNPEMDAQPGRSAAKPPMTPSAPAKPAFGKRRPS